MYKLQELRKREEEGPVFIYLRPLAFCLIRQGNGGVRRGTPLLLSQ